MDKTKKIVVMLSFLLFCTLAGVTLYKWLWFGAIDGGSIFFSFLALSYFFNALTWGNHEGPKEKDELVLHIEAQSAKISYFVLMILASIILFVSDGVADLNNIKNYPLLIVVCLTFVTLPITEYIYSRRYR